LFVPVAPIYTSYDLRYISTDSGAKTIICADTNFGYVKELKEEGLLTNIIFTRMGDLLPRYKRIIGKAFDRIPEGKVEKGRGAVPLTRLMKEKRFLERKSIPEDEPLQMLYTGGTTKNPKGVPMSHALFLESVKAQVEVSFPIVPPPENVILQEGRSSISSARFLASVPSWSRAIA